MTYHMNSELSKICSSVRLITPDGSYTFSSGSKLVAHTFSLPYVVKSLKAVDGVIEITAEERQDIDMIWTGKEHANLFDG